MDQENTGRESNTSERKSESVSKTADQSGKLNANIEYVLKRRTDSFYRVDASSSLDPISDFTLSRSAPPLPSSKPSIAAGLEVDSPQTSPIDTFRTGGTTAAYTSVTTTSGSDTELEPSLAPAQPSAVADSSHATAFPSTSRATMSGTADAAAATNTKASEAGGSGIAASVSKEAQVTQDKPRGPRRSATHSSEEGLAALFARRQARAAEQLSGSGSSSAASAKKSSLDGKKKKKKAKMSSGDIDMKVASEPDIPSMGFPAKVLSESSNSVGNAAQVQPTAPFSVTIPAPTDVNDLAPPTTKLDKPSPPTTKSDKPTSPPTGKRTATRPRRSVMLSSDAEVDSDKDELDTLPPTKRVKSTKTSTTESSSSKPTKRKAPNFIDLSSDPVAIEAVDADAAAVRSAATGLRQRSKAGRSSTSSVPSSSKRAATDVTSEGHDDADGRPVAKKARTSLAKSSRTADADDIDVYEEAVKVQEKQDDDDSDYDEGSKKTKSKAKAKSKPKAAPKPKAKSKLEKASAEVAEAPPPVKEVQEETVVEKRQPTVSAEPSTSDVVKHDDVPSANASETKSPKPVEVKQPAAESSHAIVAAAAAAEPAAGRSSRARKPTAKGAALSKTIRAFERFDEPAEEKAPRSRKRPRASDSSEPSPADASAAKVTILKDAEAPSKDVSISASKTKVEADEEVAVAAVDPNPSPVAPKRARRASVLSVPAAKKTAAEPSAPEAGPSTIEEVVVKPPPRSVRKKAMEITIELDDTPPTRAKSRRASTSKATKSAARSTSKSEATSFEVLLDDDAAPGPVPASVAAPVPAVLNELVVDEAGDVGVPATEALQPSSQNSATVPKASSQSKAKASKATVLAPLGKVS